MTPTDPLPDADALRDPDPAAVTTSAGGGAEPSSAPGTDPLEPTPAPYLPAAGVAGRGVADGRRRALSRRHPQLERLMNTIRSGVLGGVGVIGVALHETQSGALSRFREEALPVLLPFGALLVSLLTFKLLCDAWVRARYRHASFRVDADGIQIRRGVFWRVSVDIPRSRVQHTDITRGPLERRFGVATLVIHTAGTSTATVTLSGLDYRTAVALRDHLIHGDADVDDAV